MICPNEPESYVHRIGRTARAGNDGVAISFCNAQEKAFLRGIERLMRQTVPVRDTRSYGVLGSVPPQAGKPGPPRRRNRRPKIAA